MKKKIFVDEIILEEVAEKTANWPKSTGYTGIFVDTDTGEIFSQDFTSLENYARYPGAWEIMKTSRHVSADAVKKQLEWLATEVYCCEVAYK